MDIKHILLTTDLSPESIRPYRQIEDLARQYGARVTLLTVVEELILAPHGAPLAPPVHTADSGKEVERAKLALEDQAKTFGGGLQVHPEVVVGRSVASEIVAFAEENGVDLIAISTHGRTGLRRFALGSVAETVLRHAKVPVLCFPQPE